MEIIVGIFILGIVGMIIGHFARNRGGAGFLLGALLGPLGWLPS